MAMYQKIFSKVVRASHQSCMALNFGVNNAVKVGRKAILMYELAKILSTVENLQRRSG